MTQREMIVDYINRNGSITSMEATVELGITRLASRISELKELGYPIMSRFETSKNRYDKNTSYKRYFMEADHETAKSN